MTLCIGCNVAYFEPVTIWINNAEYYWYACYVCRGAGEGWVGSHRQREALNVEAENLGFETPDYVREELEDNRRHYRSSWRRETLNLKGSARSVYRDIKKGRFIKKP